MRTTSCRRSLEAGAVSPEIEELIRRIEEARGESGHSGTSMLDDVEESRPVRRQPLIHLTAPLPGADRLPRPVQRLIAETERDFNEGRRHSALDLCYVVTAQAPEFVPNYLRAAQIRIALGDIDGAMGLVESVERLQAMDGIEDDPMLRSIRVALNPDDVEGLVEHARYLLGQQVVGAGDPFLPAAIEATQEADPATARELSKALSSDARTTTRRSEPTCAPRSQPANQTKSMLPFENACARNRQRSTCSGGVRRRAWSMTSPTGRNG
ncbi:MAG: hypothetical protein R2849_22725 [Thermomicrobiales bacterium]